MPVKMIMSLSFNLAIVCLLLAPSVTSDSPTKDGISTANVTTPEGAKTTGPETTSLQGKLRGVHMVTRHKRKIYGFKRIPYAEPPVGNLRFKAPIAAGAWSGTLDASRNADYCPQIKERSITFVGNEDCLYLHVYTPKLLKNKNSPLLPVIVYIFGGRFKEGYMNSDRYGPHFLLDKDVLLVVPNFRQGVLGYLTTGDEVAPGNYALKDVVLSLKWVQDNIQYFGGDPNQVTLIGGSSGGMIASLLMLSNSTNGLFHKCVLDSGPALHMLTVQPRETLINRTTQLGEYFGCPTNTSTLLVNCLRGLSAAQLVETTTPFHVRKSVTFIVWFPTIEPDIEGALLTDSLVNFYAAGKIRDIPSIALVTRDEGLVVSVMFDELPDLFDDFLNNIDLALPELLGYAHTVRNVTAYTAALKSYYFNNLTAERSLLLANLSLMFGDSQIYYPVYKALRQQMATLKSPQYFAFLNYRGVLSYTYVLNNGSTKYTHDVAHGDEVIYLFENLDNRFGPIGHTYSKTDMMMVDTMVQLWTSFAINGMPTIANSDSTIIWEPYSSRKNYLQIGNGRDTALEIKYDLYPERMQFWDDLTASQSAYH